jgi:type IV secretory pathway VirB6-like protein
MNDNQDNSNDTTKKPGAMIQVLMGFGISLVGYLLTIGIISLANTMIVTAIIVFLILALFSFLTVRFFRKGYTAMAITMLVFISPLIVFLLLFGACAVTMLPSGLN